MSDQLTSLPIRTETDIHEKVQVKLIDSTATNFANIDADGNVHIKVHGANPAAGDEVLRLSESGNVALDGIYNATTNSNPSSAGLVASVRDAAPSATTQTFRPTGIANGTVHALDISLHDATGAAYSESNPLPVVTTQEPGTPVLDFKDDAAVAATTGTASHDYLVTATKKLKMIRVEATASGRAKFEVRISNDGTTFDTVGVKFNSTATPNVEFDFVGVAKYITGTGATLRVVKYNLENKPMDIYSTIQGVEVDDAQSATDSPSHHAEVMQPAGEPALD